MYWKISILVVRVVIMEENNKNLYNNIEKLRTILNNASMDVINDNIFKHKEIVSLSEKLDELIVEYILSNENEEN